MMFTRSSKVIQLMSVGLLVSFAGSVMAGDPAVVEQYNDVVPFMASVFVPCANGGLGENVNLDGFVHRRYTYMENGNRYTFTANNNPQNLTGVGEITGDAYRAVGKTGRSETGDIVDGMPATFTWINRFHIVGPGPENDFYVKQSEHITVTPDGEWVVERFFSEVTCK